VNIFSATLAANPEIEHDEAVRYLFMQELSTDHLRIVPGICSK
jgi:hypothetical protein